LLVSHSFQINVCRCQWSWKIGNLHWPIAGLQLKHIRVLIFYLFQIKCFEWNHKPVIYSDISTNSLSCLTGVYPAIHPMTGLQFYTCGKIEWWVLVLYFAFVPMFHDLFDVYIKSILFNIRDQSVLVQDIWICVLPVPVRLQHILHLLASFWPWGVYWII
jgi:hypothetical protein